ncbi:hypothetical protein [Microbacterium sp.]|uniref:hypothetical protein n=1 Tax=Microbacterium sp. TaxID=51671 RepID=UPI003A93A09C
MSVPSRTFTTWVGFDVPFQLPNIDEVTITLDIDAVAWQTVNLTGGPLVNPSDADAIDPRINGGIGMLVQVRAQDLQGNELRSFPGTYQYAANQTQPEFYMVRSTNVDWVTGKVTVEAASGELQHLDTRYVGTTVYDTGATTLFELARYGVGHSDAVPLTDRLSAASVPISAGDRRLIQPGESYWDFMVNELSAAGGRVFESGAGYHVIADREDPPRDTTITTLALSTSPDLDGVLVESVTETRSIDTDWADAVIVRYDYTNGAGNKVTTYQTAGQADGTLQTRALSLSRDRAASGANLATSILGRAQRRGQAFETVCAIDFAVRPGVDLTLARPSGTVDLGKCRSVEYRIHEGRMTVRSQIGEPIG